MSYRIIVVGGFIRPRWDVFLGMIIILVAGLLMWVKPGIIEFEGPPILVPILVALSAAGLVGYTAYSYMVNSRAKQALNIVAEVTDEYIVFKKPVRGRKGYIVSNGSWALAAGKTRAYRYNSEFEDHGSFEGDKVEIRDLVMNGYTYAVNRKGTGYVKLPGVLIEDPEYRDVVIGLIPTDLKYGMEPLALTAKSNTGDMATANIRVENGVLRADVSFAKRKASSVMLDIVRGSSGGILSLLTTVADPVGIMKNSGSKTFTRKLTHGARIAVVSSKAVFSPLRLRKALSRVKIAEQYSIAGFMDGEYYVRLIIGYAFKKPVIESGKLEISVIGK